MTRPRVPGIVGAVVALLVAVAPGAAVAAEPPTVTERGPSGPVIYAQSTFDLGSVGYTQSEYFLTGTAESYAAGSPLGNDGKWSVTPSTPAPFATRIVVNRPVDRRDFNGSVVVEWLNVSGGADASPDWTHMHVELIRRGYAWVGVSAQAVGLNALRELPRGDPKRYETLAHPGDSYSYDMYSQAGRAVRDDPAVLGGLRPKRVLAVGESQSAGRLVTYINAAHPVANVYDGFLVHSRGTGGSPLAQSPLPAVAVPSPTFIRDDLDVPVLVFQAENDRGIPARQDDSATYRLWEVAGTAHYDQYGLALGATDRGGRRTVAAWFDSMHDPTSSPTSSFNCDSPINTGPQTYVLRAAIAALDAWVADGTEPPSAARLETVSLDPLEYARDANGNVLGGVRTPAVDAPVAAFGGLPQGGATWCFLFGTTVPLTPERLGTLYGDQQGFSDAWRTATREALDAGFLVEEDAALIESVGTRARFMQ